MSRRVRTYIRFNPDLPVIADGERIVKFTVKGVALGQTIINTFTFIVANSQGTNTDFTDMRTLWVASFKTPWQNAFNADYNVTEYQYTTLSNRSTATQFFAVAPYGGTVMGTALPLQMAAVLGRQTIIAGQHGRGRLKMGPVPSAFIVPATDENRLTAAALAIYQVISDLQLVAYMGASAQTFTPCIAQKPPRGLYTAPPVDWTRAAQIVSAGVGDLLGTQRRRKIGVGD